MADEKQTRLSIVIRTVDQATAKINAINARLDAVTKPIRNFKSALSDMGDKLGLDAVSKGFAGVGSAIGSALAKIAMIGGIAGAAVAGVFHLVAEFDDLGDKAERFGVSVDFLAQMRYAAEQAGAPVEALDAGMLSLSENLGQLRANTGRMKKFLDDVSPALERQLKGAKDNAAAWDILAGAMAKIKDPAKRAALAQKTVGDASLAPLLAKGAKGLAELRGEYSDLAGPQQDAADKAGKVDEALHKFHATMDGVKAAIVSGLAPALGDIVERLSAWFKENRSRVAEFAAALGKRLPGAVSAVIDAIGSAVDAITPFVDSTTKLKIIAVALAAVIVGPVITAIGSLGIAIMTTPVGWLVAGLAAITAAAVFLSGKAWGVVVPAIVAVGAAMLGLPGVAIVAGIVAAATLLIQAWGPVKAFFGIIWDGITWAFQKAWEVISAIVDKIKGAVDWVKDHAQSLVSGSIDTVINTAMEADKRQSATAAAAAPAESRNTIKVDFANAPKGTRVTADPNNTHDIDLSVGYQAGGAFP